MSHSHSKAINRNKKSSQVESSDSFSAYSSYEEEDFEGDLNEYVDKLVGKQFKLALSEVTSRTKSSCIEILEEDFLAKLLRCTLKFAAQISMVKMLTFALLVWSFSSLFKYALLSEKSLPTRLALPPAPFFQNSNGILLDYFTGNGADKNVMLSNAEITVIMFYAPWNLGSMEARKPFLRVAKALKNLEFIKFIAINCHDYRGKCQKSFKLYSFPVIFAYVMGGMPIIYNQQHTTDHLFNWINYLMSSLKKVQNMDDFQELKETYDYSILAYLPIKDAKQSRPFKVFLTTAFKAASLHASTVFATIQNLELASKLGFEYENQIKFYSSYITNYSDFASLTIDDVIKSEKILSWIQNSLNSVSSKTVEEINFKEGSGKSENLFRKINSSNITLVLFTNDLRLPYSKQTKSSLEFKLLAKEFHACNKQNPKANYDYSETLENYLKTRLKFCENNFTENIKISDCCTNIYSNKLCKLHPTTSNLLFTNNKCDLLNDLHSNKEQFIRQCCKFYKNLKREQNSMFEFQPNFNSKMLCINLRLLRNSPQLQQITSSNEIQEELEIPETIRGLACRINQTVGFLRMDKRFSRYFWKLWKGKSIKYSNNSEMFADSVALISNADERIFWMEGDALNRNTISQFLLNYLNRNFSTVKHENNAKSKLEFVKSDKNHSIIQKISDSIFITEFIQRSQNFDSVVLFSNGAWHGPSQVLGYILHSVKNYFGEFDSFLRFFILNSSKSTLPWQYNFDSLPVIVFFPAHRKAETSIFPRNLPLTIPNLMAFLLARCQQELLWRLAISTCTPECLRRNISNLTKFSRAVTLDIRGLKLAERLRPKRFSSYFRILLKRRRLQKRSVKHLRKVLGLLYQTKYANLSESFKTELISDSLFLKWLLKNRFGLSYKT